MTKFSKIKLNKNIYDILKMILPKQGSIEIQRDFPKNTQNAVCMYKTSQDDRVNSNVEGVPFGERLYSNYEYLQEKKR